MLKKTKTTFRLIIFLVVFLSPFLLLSDPQNASSATPAFNYTPMEEIPGQGKPKDFYDYINAIYKFGISAVGIAALLMISIGGYMYLTSAGNASAMDAAKGVITDAIVGVILALSSYLLLYIINPDLVRIKKMEPIPTPISSTTKPAPPSTIPGQEVCQSGKCSQINSAINNNPYGISLLTLRSLLVGGEGCNKNKSPAGACGYSQTMPTIRTWCGIKGNKEETCAKVQNDPQIDINCAAKLLKEDMMKRCGSDISQIASCYNTGKKDNCAKSENKYCDRVATFYLSCASR